MNHAPSSYSVQAASHSVVLRNWPWISMTRMSLVCAMVSATRPASASASGRSKVAWRARPSVAPQRRHS